MEGIKIVLELKDGVYPKDADSGGPGYDIQLARQMGTIQNTVKDVLDAGGSEARVPLPEVTSATMDLITVYCQHHKDDNDPVDEDPVIRCDDIKEWDTNFLKTNCGLENLYQVENPEIVKKDLPKIYSIILAANFLNLKPLVDLGCKTIANVMRDKSVEYLRTLLDLKDDWTDEERKLVMRHNEWLDGPLDMPK